MKKTPAIARGRHAARIAKLRGARRGHACASVERESQASSASPVTIEIEPAPSIALFQIWLEEFLLEQREEVPAGRVLEELATFFQREGRWSWDQNSFETQVLLPPTLASELELFAREFPFVCAADLETIRRLTTELETFTRWCARKGFISSIEMHDALHSLEAARPDLSKQLALQAAIEQHAIDTRSGPGRTRVEGLFTVVGRYPFGIVVSDDEGKGYEVRVPGWLRGLYHDSARVGLKLVRGVAGWVPFASSLPREHPSETLTSLEDHSEELRGDILSA